MAQATTTAAEPRLGVNPLVDRFDGPVPPPCAMVVFGASVDLAASKLLPALARLAARGQLPVAFAVVGVARSEWDDDEFRQFARKATSSLEHTRRDRDPAWQDVVSGLRFVAGEYDSDETFHQLAKVLDEVDRTQGTEGNRLYYLAVPPLVVPTVIAALGRHRLAHPPPARPGTFTRIVIEKPYGTDLHSAQELDRSVHEVFDESQVYRIDHFLGKETVQNLLAVRFANAVFEPIWNRRYVDSVQITVAEAVGVGHRAAFFEETGTLRDMVQNHVMQILALTLMEPPITMAADGIRDEKVKALRAVEIPDRRHVPNEVVRAQYLDGWVSGLPVRGYREEPGVGPSSARETYVALRLRVDNWRWAGVPFYLRTGKRLPKRVSEVAVQFHAPPHVPFGPDQTRGLKPDALVLRIHPDDGIALIFGTKVPGHGFDVRSVAMEFLYEAAFPGERPEAYERLLLDAMVGDPTLFIRTDEVMQAWRMMAPILEAWERDDPPLAFYRAGSWGPIEADDLLRRDGRSWRNP
jgi:glucose-6-phosphate 1-dehydrogenase